MKIFITGATGFIGGYLTRYFAEKGHTVLASGRGAPPKRLLDYADYVPLDLRADIRTSIEADVCIHAGALASDSASYSSLYDANVSGTRRLLDAIRGVPTLIHISSSSVYAFRSLAPQQPQCESDAGKDFKRLTAYGQTKWLAEEAIMEDRNPSQQRLILRPRAVYGVGDRVILPRLLAMVRGNRFIMPGKMDTFTSMTNIAHIAGCIERFMLNERNPALTTLNIADSMSYPMGESIHGLLEAIYGKSLKKRSIPIGLLQFIARTGVSNHVTPFLIQAVSKDSLLDTSCLRALYPLSSGLNLGSATPLIQEWIAGMGGVKAYLKNQQLAPWL